MGITVNVVVPAHLASTRLPRKVLMEVAGTPMLRRVLAQCSGAVPAERVRVATPDEEILAAVAGWGYRGCRADPRATNGTGAVASVVGALDADYIVNVQADQPLIPSALIASLVENLGRTDADVVTPVYRIRGREDLEDPGVAKVVRNHGGWALYFSRTAIPYVWGTGIEEWAARTPCWGHYGIYGYRREVLLRMHELKVSALEDAEGLEQLRFLENGLRVWTFETEYRQWAVDTLDDLKKVEAQING